jgi:hypothetical protein
MTAAPRRPRLPIGYRDRAVPYPLVPTSSQPGTIWAPMPGCGIDLLAPVWHVLDLTRPGRGNWYAQLDYTANGGGR